MSRTRRGYIARRRRTKFRDSFGAKLKGAHARLNRVSSQQIKKALASSHRDRGRKKRDFRRLWITRLNAAIRKSKIFASYSRLIHNLYEAQLLLNRKILAQVAVLNRNCLSMISNEII